MMKTTICCVLFVLIPCFAVAGGIQLLEATALSGDKIKGRSEQGIYYIDLHGIDAPEKDQPFGDDSASVRFLDTAGTMNASTQFLRPPGGAIG